MDDKIIPFRRHGEVVSTKGLDTGRVDRHVAMVEAILNYVKDHPGTSADQAAATDQMRVADARLLLDLINAGLQFCQHGPYEFEAWASKDLAHFEQWLSHYRKQVKAFLDAQTCVQE